MKTYKIWHGESDIADVVNHAGFWVNEEGIPHDESKIFDDEPNSLWHSAVEYKDKDKIIGFEFKVIFFSQIFHPLPTKTFCSCSVFFGIFGPGGNNNGFISRSLLNFIRCSWINISHAVTTDTMRFALLSMAMRKIKIAPMQNMDLKARKKIRL